jgi:hypothetical protein
MSLRTTPNHHATDSEEDMWILERFRSRREEKERLIKDLDSKNREIADLRELVGKLENENATLKLGRVAAQNSGNFTVRGSDVPQHDELLKRFEQLRTSVGELSVNVWPGISKEEAGKAIQQSVIDAIARKTVELSVKDRVSNQLGIFAVQEMFSRVLFKAQVSGRTDEDTRTRLMREAERKLRMSGQHFKSLGEVCSKAQALLDDLERANPPAEVYFPEKGTEFDSDKQESMNPFPEGGRIALVVYPGFQEAGTRPVCKARVVNCVFIPENWPG